MKKLSLYLLAALLCLHPAKAAKLTDLPFTNTIHAADLFLIDTTRTGTTNTMATAGSNILAYVTAGAASLASLTNISVYASNTVNSPLMIVPFTGGTNGPFVIMSTNGTSPRFFYSTNGSLTSRRGSADTTGVTFNLDKARGTLGTPTIITTGDTLGTISFNGYDGSTYTNSAQIAAVSSGTIGQNRIPSSLVFRTMTDASPGVLTDRLTIYGDGTSRFIWSGANDDVTVSSLGQLTMRSNAAGTFFKLTSTGIIVSSTSVFSFNSQVDVGGGSADLALRRDAAATLALHNTTVAAQTFRVYETTDSGLANYGRLSFQTQAGNYLIRTEAAGTGTLRTLQVGTGPTNGTDKAGYPTILHGGPSTGTGIGGPINFQISPATTTGSSVNSLVTGMTLNGDGGLQITPLTGSTNNAFQINGTNGVASFMVRSNGNVNVTGTLSASSSIDATSFSANGSTYAAGATLNGSLTLPGVSGVAWSGRSIFKSPSDGTITMFNNATTDFSVLQFGGVTASFPSIKRSATNLQVRLADDSAFSGLAVKNLQVAKRTNDWASTVVVDMGGYAFNDIFVTNSFTLSATNYAEGRMKAVRLVPTNYASNYVVTIDSTFQRYDSLLATTSLTVVSNKNSILDLKSWGTTGADIQIYAKQQN